MNRAGTRFSNCGAERAFKAETLLSLLRSRIEYLEEENDELRAEMARLRNESAALMSAALHAAGLPTSANREGEATC